MVNRMVPVKGAVHWVPNRFAAARVRRHGFTRLRGRSHVAAGDGAGDSANRNGIEEIIIDRRRPTGGRTGPQEQKRAQHLDARANQFLCQRQFNCNLHIVTF